jgi:hypothetical protein
MVPNLILGIALALGTADDAKASNATAPGRSTASDTLNKQKPATEAKPADDCLKEDSWMDHSRCFGIRLFKAYKDEFCPDEGKNGDKCNGEEKKNGDDEKKNGNGEGNGSERRAMESPFMSPPFPSGEYQGFPLIGIPPSDTVYPLTKALYGGCCGDELKDSRMKIYGWLNTSGNLSTNKRSNTPDSYWVAPNRMALDQAALRFERETDSAQTDHIDVGFRVTGDYGIDYRYFTAGGWFSDQLLVHNKLYGWDLTECYAEIYIPYVAEGMKLTIGRWIATPDIETQFSPDNFMGTHSIQFTVDVYTETGLMASIMLNKQWMVQACIHAGADMAPWYSGAVPTGMFGVRWVSEDNNDSFYTVLNAINNAQFQYFTLRGVPAGHHNYNIIQSTWQHRFSERFQTRTEAYYMWEFNASVGGTPSIGPVQFNSGGGLGAFVPGRSDTYGLLNYTAYAFSKSDFLVLRNEWMKDEHGTRYGFAGNYSSHSIGWTHFINPLLMVRPEIGYYRNYNTPAFDNGLKKDMWLAGFDVTLRF